MNIKAEHIAYKKNIGKLDGRNVIEVATTGGLHLVLQVKNGQPDLLASGPHGAIARHIASKKEPNIVFTELSKADYMEPYLYMALIPEYERLTEQMRSMWKK